MSPLMQNFIHDIQNIMNYTQVEALASNRVLSDQEQALITVIPMDTTLLLRLRTTGPRILIIHSA